MRDSLLQAFRELDDWPATAARLRAEHRAVYDAVVNGDPALAHPRLVVGLNGRPPVPVVSERGVG